MSLSSPNKNKADDHIVSTDKTNFQSIKANNENNSRIKIKEEKLPLFLRKNSGSNLSNENNKITIDSCSIKLAKHKNKIKLAQRKSETYEDENNKDKNKLNENENLNILNRQFLLNNDNIISKSNSNPSSSACLKANINEKANFIPTKIFDFEDNLLNLNYKNKETENDLKEIKDKFVHKDYHNAKFFDYDLLIEKNKNLFFNYNKMQSDDKINKNIAVKQKQNLSKKANFQTIDKIEKEGILNSCDIIKFNSWNTSSSKNNTIFADEIIKENLFQEKNLQLFNSSDSSKFDLTKHHIDKPLIIKNINSNNINNETDVEMNDYKNDYNQLINLDQFFTNNLKKTNNKVTDSGCSDFKFLNKLNNSNYCDNTLQVKDNIINSDLNFALEHNFITNNKKIDISNELLSCYEKRDTNIKSLTNNSSHCRNKDFNPLNIKVAKIESFISNSNNAINFDNKFSSQKNKQMIIYKNDFMRKFNTSDAVKAPRIIIDLKDYSSVANTDSKLLVTAEMEKSNKTNNINRLSGLNFMSNNRSNKSTSNDDSKELINFNSKESNSDNNNLNYNNFNRENLNKNINQYEKNNIHSSWKKSEISNFNSMRNFTSYNSSKTNNKIFLEKESNFKSTLQLSKIKSQNKSDNQCSNSHLSLKTKQSQKNQIFFPVEISIKSFHSVNSFNNSSSSKTRSDIPTNENVINFKIQNNDKKNKDKNTNKK